jgi:ATP/maltotriose-dependent transcriptional regulator MalT
MTDTSVVLAADERSPDAAALEGLSREVERALVDAQRAGDDPRRLRLTTSLGTVRWWQGDPAAAVAAWRAALPLARSVAEPAVELAVHLGMARATATEGAWDEAARHLAAAAIGADRSGRPTDRVRVALGRAELEERRGHLHAALALAESVWVAAPERGGPVVVRLCLALGDADRASGVVAVTGDPQDAARVALQRGEVADWPPELAPWAAALAGRWDEVAGSGVLAGFAALVRGDADAALAVFDLARITRAADGWPVEAAVCGLWSAGAMAVAGRARAATGLLAELEVLVDDADPEAIAPSFDLARARVARSSGDETTAQALAASARARTATPALHVRVDLRAFGA